MTGKPAPRIEYNLSYLLLTFLYNVNLRDSSAEYVLLALHSLQIFSKFGLE